MATTQGIKVVHRWEDGQELSEAELAERRQALALSMADEWARAKGYKMTVAQRAQSLDAAAGE
jgi:hypothetical protein